MEWTGNAPSAHFPLPIIITTVCRSVLPLITRTIAFAGEAPYRHNVFPPKISSRFYQNHHLRNFSFNHPHNPLFTFLSPAPYFSLHFSSA